MLARWNNPARSPAMAERVLGDGRVLLWTTTADRAGNDWPIEPSFVLAVREAVRGSARPTRFDNTVTGRRADEARRHLEPAGLPTPALTLPGGGEPRALAVVPLGEEPGDRGPAVEINVPDTRQPGVVSSRLGRRSAGDAARSVRGQSRPARKQARTDGRRRAEVDVRAAGDRDRRPARRWLRSLRRDRPRDLARHGGRACSFCWLSSRYSQPGSAAHADAFPIESKAMNRIWQMLLGIEPSSPGVVTGGDSHLEFASLPRNRRRRRPDRGRARAGRLALEALPAGSAASFRKPKRAF